MTLLQRPLRQKLMSQGNPLKGQAINDTKFVGVSSLNQLESFGLARPSVLEHALVRDMKKDHKLACGVTLRREIQRRMDKPRMVRARFYARYMEDVEINGRAGGTPPITLWVGHAEVGECGDLIIPYGEPLIAIDGETQTEGRFMMRDDDEFSSEIRENFDRKELKPNERASHLTELGAIMQKRLQKRKHIEVNNGQSVNNETRYLPKRQHGKAPKPVREEVARALGISKPTLDSRVKAASKIVKKAAPDVFTEDLDLDMTPPEKLEEAARVLRDTPSARKGPPPKGEPFSLGEETSKGRRLRLKLYPADAVAFAKWIRQRHPKIFTLDDIRAYRDALAELVKELEA